MDSIDQRRGWLWEGGWWRKEDWSIKVKFIDRAENMFFSSDDLAELQLQDAVQYVTHVARSQRLLQSDLGIEVLFDALDFSKPSPLESIDVDLNDADAAGLEKAIKYGCLQSLKYLRFHNYTGNRLVTLANTMASHGLPSLETLFLNRVNFDLTRFTAYGNALAPATLPKLRCFHISRRALNRNEGVKSILLAMRASNLKNWAIGITDEGLTVVMNSVQDSVASLFSYVRSLYLGLYSFTEVGLLSIEEVLSSGKLQNLTFLDVSGNDLGNEGAKTLKVAIRSGELKNLAELRLNKFGLTDEGLIALVDSFQEGVGRILLPNLISLDIGLNSFTKVGLLSLSKALSAGKLPKLSCLNISGNNIGNEAANCLRRAIWSGQLTNLAELGLNKIGLTDEGLFALVDGFQEGVEFATNLPSLRILKLGDNSITEAGLLSLSSIGLAIRSSGHFKNLALGITNEGLSMISVEDPFQQNVASVLQDLSSGNFHKLLCLEISGNDIGDEGAKSLIRAIRSSELEKLVQLRLSRIGLTDEGLKALVDSFQEGVGRRLLPNLISLDIGLNSFTKVGLLSLSKALSAGKLPKLSCLDISGNNIGNEAANCLRRAIWSGQLTNLAELRLNKIGLTDEGLFALVDGFQEGVEFAANLPGLRVLELGDNSITEAGLLSLSPVGRAIRFGNVKNLAIGITNEGLSMISVEDPFQQNVASVLQDLSSGNLQKLLCLDISGNDVGDEGAKSLGRAIRSSELEKLVQLRLSRIGLTDEGLKALIDSFQEGVGRRLLPSLISFEIGLNSFTKVGLLSLSKALSAGKLPKLSCLDISGNNIGNEAANYLRRAIWSGQLTNLAELRLNKIGLTDEGLFALVDGFQEGVEFTANLPSLRILKLGDNSITEASLLSLSSIGLAIRSSGYFKNLALGITNEGLSMIAVEDPFQQNVSSVLQDLSSGNLHKLLCLDISGNDVGDEGAKSLGRAIRSRELEKLVQLRLSRMGLTDDGLKALVDSFQEGVGRRLLPNLISLDIGLNSFTKVGLLSLSKALSAGKLPKLSCLDISGNNIGNKAADCLRRAIWSGQLTNLAELRLNKIGLTDEGLFALVDGVHEGVEFADNLPNLRVLELGDNSTTEAGLLSLSHVGRAIRFRNVKNLAIGITNEGLSMISVEDPFQQNVASVLQDLSSGNLHKLLCLDISGIEIGYEGAKSLGRAIRSRGLEKLVQLRLSEVGLTDESLKALVDSFQARVRSLLPNLGLLDLASNFFTEKGMFALGEALKSGHLNSLEVLAVRRSADPSKEGARALVSALLSNSFLTLDVEFEWYKFPELNRRREQLLQRNYRKRDILAGLVTVSNVQATFGKVYLCGNPEVGKTTLCSTLQRSFWKSLITWERRPHAEERTRGIVVSQLSSKANKPEDNLITLLVWDMAGQEDFHLVHNAFFPDLGFAEGKATTFIVVCNSKDSPNKSMEQLEYWLRYIASCCDKAVQNPRHVFVVMNKFGGGRKIKSDAKQYWKMVLEGKRDKFKHHLKIQTELFLVDVRKFKRVVGLKSCLLEHSSNLLRNQEVPNICQAIQKNLRVLSQQREQFPVLQWTEFVEQIADQLQVNGQEDEIEAATKYLNEAGVMIYINMEGIRLVVVDPTWLCREIIGKVFLPSDMTSPTEDLFRKQVDQSTGSISISDFKRFFKSLRGEWDEAQVDHLIAILLWLGLCYKGKDQNVFLPALIAERGRPGDPWSLPATVLQGRDQWVMGFSVTHEKNEVALAPISLWHRFQVDLAQSPKFNGQRRRDNDFVANKYFVTFVVDYMNVLIEADASLEKPTFEEISILVKPRFEREDLDAAERKQCQVDLANDLVERLLNLWNKVCPGVEYAQRVIWPWPASSARPSDKPERNVEVAEVMKWVQERGVGTRMYWPVGIDDPITEDQLLSTKDKIDVVQSVEHTLSVVTQGMKEAVNLGIFPPDVLAADAIDMPTSAIQEVLELDESDIKFNNLLSRTLSEKLKPIHYKMDKIYKKLGKVENLVREGFGDVLNKQKLLLQKLQDTEKMFLEDRQSICPKFIYLRTTDSVFVRLKDALSLSKTVRLHFACEAGYDTYRPHADVENQEGLDVSQLTDWGRTVLPWLKVSLTVLFISAKVAANLVAPGLGLIVPSFVDWQQTTTLLDGLALATGLSKDELEQKIAGTGLDADDANGDPQGLYKKSRKAISELLGKLTHKDFEEKIGLRKVRLAYHDGSLHGVVWICTACLKKFPTEMVSEL